MRCSHTPSALPRGKHLYFWARWSASMRLADNPLGEVDCYAAHSSQRTAIRQGWDSCPLATTSGVDDTCSGQVVLEPVKVTKSSSRLRKLFAGLYCLLEKLPGSSLDCINCSGWNITFCMFILGRFPWKIFQWSLHQGRLKSKVLFYSCWRLFSMSRGKIFTSGWNVGMEKEFDWKNKIWGPKSQAW